MATFLSPFFFQQVEQQDQQTGATRLTSL